ncbi:LacI family DNA-binding transcriptional regulator [Kocuria sp.]|uniref:LacI family DNA-binding transcriptional regulator n=1 Tax=Kocuria sp. TaxID=1871328 RepID=UPI0026DF9EB7|nr:LacI family DNA-binding transcriptional regulator [Kocuria sp.]MDO5619323.1 LacI family DNA-binding transcriptional regulator [Kocuria sp.]
MGVTLVDVARAAGVSRTTASNAFNNPTQLSRELREEVLRTAKNLGYAGPSPVARAMRRGRTMMIGIVFQESLTFILEDPYARGLLGGLSDRLTEAKYSLALIPVDGTGAGLEHVQVDGMVGYHLPPQHPAFQTAQQRGWKIVQTVDSEDAQDKTNTVTIDEAGGARLALQHLADLGHTRVHILIDAGAEAVNSSSIEPTFPYREQQERWRGFKDVAIRRGVELIPVPTGRNIRADGYAASRNALSTGSVTAIAAMTDVLAFGAMDAVTSAGLRVGHDVSIVGFDDVPESAELELTTVAQPIHRRGLEIGSLILASETFKQVNLPCELIIRKSTGVQNS